MSVKFETDLDGRLQTRALFRLHFPQQNLTKKKEGAKEMTSHEDDDTLILLLWLGAVQTIQSRPLHLRRNRNGICPFFSSFTQATGGRHQFETLSRLGGSVRR